MHAPRTSNRTCRRYRGGRHDRFGDAFAAAFWTLTYWDDEHSLRKFMLKLARWCDESAVTHWHHDAEDLPGWDIATARLAEDGRLSRVEYPSELQRSGRVGVS